MRYEVLGPDPAGVVVRVELPDGCHRVLGARVRETPQRVAVQVFGARPAPDQLCTQVLGSATYVVPLRAPLGSRTVTR